MICFFECYSIRLDIVQPQAHAFNLHPSSLRAFTSPQSYSLAVFLKLCDQLIALLDYVVVLLVLIIRSVSLNNSLSSYSIDSAWDAFGCNEFGKIAINL